MKKRFWNVFTMVVLCIAMVAIASCSKDSDIQEPTPAPSPTPTPKDTTAKYTVMFYGCGGGDIDDDMENNLRQVEDAGLKDSVNFVGLVKNSIPWQGDEGYAGTRYLTMTKDGLKSEKKYEASYRMDDPAHLANFIKETKEKMPAKKYILVFYNHGSVFGDGDKLVQDSYPDGPVTRGLLFDDNIGSNLALSTFEIEKAIKEAGVNIELIYLDCCLMGMVETYYQLKDCTHYIMGSLNIVPGYAGDYTRLMNDLQEQATLEDAIKDYVPGCVQRWYDNGVRDSADLGCFDLTYMAELKELAKVATSYLQELLPDENVHLVENITGDGFYIEHNKQSTADLSSSFSYLAYILDDDVLAGYADNIKNTVEKMKVAGKDLHTQWKNGISMGITWPTDYFWDWYSQNSKNYYEGYRIAIDNSSFMQETGWGKFLNDVTVDF